MTYNENLDFIRYSKPLNCLLFQYKKGDRLRIAKIDLNTWKTDSLVSRQNFSMLTIKIKT